MIHQFEPLPWPDARFDFLDDDSGGFSFHCIIVPFRQRTLDEGSTSCILGALLTTLSMPIVTFFPLFVSFLYHRRSSSLPQAKLCLSAQRAIVLAVTGHQDMGLRCVWQRNTNGKRAEEGLLLLLLYIDQFTVRSTSLYFHPVEAVTFFEISGWLVAGFGTPDVSVMVNFYQHNYKILGMSSASGLELRGCAEGLSSMRFC